MNVREGCRRAGSKTCGQDGVSSIESCLLLAVAEQHAAPAEVQAARKGAVDTVHKA